jgi:hypothetical protein
MTLSLQEISDRIEIQDLLVAYSHAIDTRSWDALDDVFTADAVIDYTAMGGTRGDLAETKAFLAEALTAFTTMQHLVATSAVELDGDVARGRPICPNPLLFAPGPGGGGPTQLLFAGLWYRDTFVRTPEGWRIRERVEERGYLEVLSAAVAPTTASRAQA